MRKRRGKEKEMRKMKWARVGQKKKKKRKWRTPKNKMIKNKRKSNEKKLGRGTLIYLIPCEA
jgi:hypothetical protein